MRRWPKMAVGLCGILAAMACEKADENCPGWRSGQIFQPMEYLPVYPGSSWTYVDTSGTLVVKSVSTAYRPHSFENGTCRTHLAFVPYWDDMYMYGYRYPAGTSSGEKTNRLVYLLKDAPAGTWWELDHWAGTVLFSRILSRDTTILANGLPYSNVIMVGDASGVGPSQCSYHEFRYYAKDIGLVRVDEVNFMDTVSVLELTQYHIEH